MKLKSLVAEGEDMHSPLAEEDPVSVLLELTPPSLLRLAFLPLKDHVH